nr:OB-fold nucleic acid binding domain-containing protein [Actinomycetota bacterium]
MSSAQARVKERVAAAQIADSGQHEAQLLAERREKVDRLRAAGIEPFQGKFHGRTPVAAVHEAHGDLTETGEHPDFRFRVAGRMTARREHGKTTFLDLIDGSGTIQLYAREDDVGEEAYGRIVALDVGDIVGADGCVYVTKRGELAIKVQEATLLCKALRPPPEKFHGLSDVETRSRRRELDLMANQASREVFVTRAKIIAAVRRFFDGEGFVEVETPVLQPLYGGALA